MHNIFFLNTIIIGMSIFPKLSYAQSDSQQVQRFVYEFHDVNFKERSYNDLMNLDIQSDGTSLFYSAYNSEKGLQVLENKDVDAVIDKLESSKRGAAFKIFTSRLNNEMIYIAQTPDNFYYKEKLPNLNWAIIDSDTMTISGYLCKKATTTYGGRYWTAWYTEELPLACGPWKLNGLPGLILSAYDSDNYFEFICVGIEQTFSNSWDINTKDYIKCTNFEYQKQLRLQAEDPVNYALRKLGLATVDISDVTVIDDANGNSLKELPKIERIYMEKISGDKK